MPTFWKQVDVPEQCFLHEALLWLAFKRLPVAFYTNAGKEVRDEAPYDGFELQSPEGYLTDDECRRAGIPPDPHFHYLMDESPRPLRAYDDLEPLYGHDEAVRRINEAMDKEQADHERACDEWQVHYDGATEYAASQIFVALRDGRLRANGRLLPLINADAAFELLKAEDRHISDLPLTEIPHSFWTLKGIDFEISAARNSEAHYCQIVLQTSDLLAVFPGDRQPITAERVGDTIILNEIAYKARPPRTARGRPSYPWEHFHLEVSALLKRDELPAKKEAAIQHFQSWFERELSVRPSRAAIGEKLTPYYDRFLRGRGQKT